MPTPSPSRHIIVNPTQNGVDNTALVSGDLIPRTDRRRALFEYVHIWYILNTPFTTIEIFYAGAYAYMYIYIYI